MALTLPDHIRVGRDKRGKVFNYTYTDEYTGDDDNCLACQMGSCIQKIVWYMNRDGTVDTASHVIWHDVRAELS